MIIREGGTRLRRQRQAKMRGFPAALAVLGAILVTLSYTTAQSLYSPYPSRSTILAQADRPRSNASVVNHIRTHTEDRVVLGYVTPWNPRGIELAEQFRGKFDIISPTWHNVDVVHTDGKAFYVVNGGSTGPKDDEWRNRMQQPAKDGNGKPLSAVKIAPRFVLDRFTPDDLVELLSSDDLMKSLAQSIILEVEKHKYDGVVFECGAVWAIEALIQMLAEGLHAGNKILAVVVPALKKNSEEGTEQTNKIAIHAMRSLAPHADHVMVMTYDHAASVGQAYKDTHGLEDLPKGSPLSQEGVRTPGPNSPLDYITMNIETMSGNLETGGASTPGQYGMPGNDPTSPFYDAGGFSHKLLVGVALYGYRYPIGWFDKTANTSDGIARIPPKSPMVSQDNDTDVQAEHRAKAEKREQDEPNIVPVLRFPGDAFKHSDLAAQLRQSKALIRLDEASQEQFVDYVAPLATDHQNTVADRLGMNDTQREQASKTRALASYYRAYFPSAHTIKKRLITITSYPNVGIALWDVGQAGEWLLHEL